MKKLVSLAVYLFATVALAQTPQLIKEQGDRYFANEQYFKAIEFYKRALLLNEDMTSAKYELANAYRLTFDYESAEAYYGQVESTSGADQVYPLAGYYHGLMKKLNGDLQGAILELDKAIETMKENGYSESEEYRKYYIQAKIEKEGCQFALNELSKPKINRNFKALEEPVNTEFNDYAAYTIENDSTLAISSGRSSGTTGSFIDNRFGESFADVFRFSKSDDGWEKTRDRDRFDKIINTKWGDGAGTFNQDRTKFYYTYCDAENQGGCFIYVTSLEDGKWTEPVALNENINLRNYNSKHPSITPNGDTLFFTSDRPEGVGEFDIWYSVSISGDNWGQAKNMGNQVNTSFNEISPFYDAKESALFFASDGHRGFGGLDIFLAKGNYLTNPEIFNLGAPYNSNQDECFFMLGNHKGYISSNRDGGPGKFDIYSFNIETDKEIISEIEVEEAIAGRNSIFSDDYDFDTDNTEKIEEVISQLLASRFAGTKAVLSSEDQNFYNNLSKDDKDRVDRIVKARFRNMAQSEMRALRVEDEFYYQNLGYEERQAIDQMIISRIEQKDLGLSVRYNNISLQFYESLPKEEKEKVDQFIAFKVKEAEDKSVIEENYQSLDTRSKREVDNITGKYFREKKDLEALSLTPTSLMFVNSLEGQKKETIFSSVKERITNLSTGTEYELVDQDRIFYQNLNGQQLDNLENIATAFLTSDLDEFSQNIEKQDLAFYQQLNSTQKKSADRVLAKMINNIVIADLYLADALLTKKEIADLSDLRKSASTISEAMRSLETPEPRTIEQLTQENLERIDRFIASVSSKQYIEGNIEGFFPEDALQVAEQNAIVANQDDPDNGTDNVETKETVDQSATGSSDPVTGAGEETAIADSETTDPSGESIAMSGEDSGGQGNERVTGDDEMVEQGNSKDPQSKTKKIVPVSRIPENSTQELELADATFYDEKEPNDRLFIDRIIGASYLNTFGTVSQVSAKAYQLYKELTSEQKDYIKLLARKFQGEEINPQLLVPALNFYNSSAPSVKEEWNLMVFSRALESDKGKYTAGREYYVKYNQLPDEEKNIIERIKQHRLANRRLIPDIQVVEAKDIPDRKVIQNLVTYNTGQYDFIYISGQLTDEATGKPMTNYPLAIRKKNGELAYETYTDNQGKFVFENIKSENYDIVSGSADEVTLDDQGFFIRSLEVRGANENLYDRKVSTRVYFDSGSDGLRSEAVVTLDEIAQVAKENPGMIVELNGHTDNVGGEELNLSLSRERSEMVYDYLVKKGVPANKIIINFFGQSKPITENSNAFGRQFNRRVDVILKDDEYIKYQPASIYLVRPKGTFYSIAKNFGVSIDEIRKWNGMDQEDVLQAYKPLRIKNPERLKPNLDMLVELNASVESGYREYTVQSGDTLRSIAQKFNVPEELLMEINNLSSDRLKPGQKIRIYVSF